MTRAAFGLARYNCLKDNYPIMAKREKTLKCLSKLSISEKDKLKTENETLKKALEESKSLIKRMESRLDSHISKYDKEKKKWGKDGKD